MLGRLLNELPLPWQWGTKYECPLQLYRQVLRGTVHNQRGDLHSAGNY